MKFFFDELLKNIDIEYHPSRDTMALCTMLAVLGNIMVRITEVLENIHDRLEERNNMPQ